MNIYQDSIELSNIKCNEDKGVERV